ncbi:MAG: response regulator [Ancalomicrobiaceae bacterium]|nr:response regulator [Ancalomicrobiaceae bacterium]
MDVHRADGMGDQELKERLLIVDDSRSVLSLMSIALGQLPGVEIDTCLSWNAAWTKILNTQYDALIVDYFLPEGDGISLVRRLREREDYRTIPIVMVTSALDRETRFEALAAGVNDFLTKPFDSFELQARIVNLLALRRAQVQLARHAADLSEAVIRATREIVLREEEMIWRLALAIEMRDGVTGDHVTRVAEISRTIARGLGLAEHHCQMIYLAAPLHDIGKIGVPDAILGKPGRLSATEMQEMRRHVEYGIRVLGNGASDLLKVAAAIVGGHHEKWDGSGYPAGLAGEDIPIEARIVAVADVFDALCSERPYKPAWPLHQAIEEMQAGNGTHFDPACIAVFRATLPEIIRIMTSRQMAHWAPSTSSALAIDIQVEQEDTSPIIEWATNSRRASR